MVISPIRTVRSDKPGGAVTSRPLRILHVSKRFWPFRGGVERYVEDLAHAQAGRGDDVTVLTIDRDLVAGSPVGLPLTDSHRGIRVERVPAIGSARKQFAIGRLSMIIHQIRSADVVHHHDPRLLFETVLAVRRLAGRPVILHTHGFIWHTDDFQTLKRLALRLYYGPILRHMVDTIVASSAADAERLRETANVAGAHVRVLPNAIDLSRYGAIMREPEDGFVLTFGRIDTHKGLAFLFRALANARTPWRLRIAGTGSEDVIEALKLTADGVGIGERIDWLGRVDDRTLEALLSKASVAVFPSQFEGFGLALLEAMAAGVQVVATDIDAHREVLGPDLAWLMVPIDDPDMTAAAIDEALERPGVERRGLEAALRRRSGAFDLDRHLRSLDSIYEELGVTHV